MMPRLLQGRGELEAGCQVNLSLALLHGSSDHCGVPARSLGQAGDSATPGWCEHQPQGTACAQGRVQFNYLLG